MQTIIDTYNTTENYDYESYVDYCEACERKPDVDGSSDYYDYVNMNIEEDVEAFWDNLQSMYETSNYCAITGTLGLWNGNREVEVTFANNLYEAIRKCVGESDYMIISLNNGIIEVEGIHHDGINYFEIRLLSKHGENEMDRSDFDIDNDNNFQKIEYLF